MILQEYNKYKGVVELEITQVENSSIHVKNKSTTQPIYSIRAFYIEGMQHNNKIKYKKHYQTEKRAILEPGSEFGYTPIQKPVCGLNGGLQWGVEYEGINGYVYEYKQKADFSGTKCYEESGNSINYASTIRNYTWYNPQFWELFLLIIIGLFLYFSGIITITSILQLIM